MTPQEWIEKVEEPECAAAFYATQKVHKQAFVTEGAQHLSAALEEIARLQAQLSRAERVVVPEWSANDFAMERVKPGSYIDGDLRAIFRNAEAGYRFAASRVNSVPASRVLNDGEMPIAYDLAESALECISEACRRHLSGHGMHADEEWRITARDLQDALRSQGKDS